MGEKALLERTKRATRDLFSYGRWGSFLMLQIERWPVAVSQDYRGLSVFVAQDTPGTRCLFCSEHFSWQKKSLGG